jgi:nitronate monooxygenase
MTSILQRIGVELPIVQAPMAGTSTPALAAAVTNAGALGSISVGAVDAARAGEMIATLKAQTDGPFNVNVFTHKPAKADPARERAWIEMLRPLFAAYEAEPPSALTEIYKSFSADPDMLEALISAKPAVVSFHFGLPPESFVRRLKDAGILLFASATNPDEGRQVERAGIDAVVAQGWEAGGHRGIFDPMAPDSRLGTAALARLLVKKLSIPVIAAGGIMDGAGVAAALDLGAHAAQLGTAFVVTPESSADAYHRAALLGPGAAATEMTAQISGRPARSLPNRFTALTTDVPTPDYPIAYDAGKALAIAAKAKGEGGFGAQWAGQGAPLARPMPAADLVRLLAQELEAAHRGR